MESQSTYIISLGGHPFHPSVPSSVPEVPHPGRRRWNGRRRTTHGGGSSLSTCSCDLIVQHVRTQSLASVICAKSIQTFGGEIASMEQYTHQDSQPMNKAKMRNALERNKLEGDRMSILLLLPPPPQQRPPQQHVAAAALRQASHTTMMLDPIMRAASTSLGTKADMGVQQQSTSG